MPSEGIVTGSAAAAAAMPLAAGGAAAAGSSAPAAAASLPPAVVLKNFTFNYGTAAGFKPVLRNMNLSLPQGARCLLVGDNGAGKSSLLRVLAGRHLHEEEAVQVLGRSSFHDTTLNNSRSYLSTEWGRRTVAFSGHGCAISADIGVTEMLSSLQQEFPQRRDELVELLGIDLSWRMHQLSDGQRRRVQIMLQLLAPRPLLLLDEITTDLDLITRQDFLNHLKTMSERDGVTIIYATHIFDGLDGWPTHLAYIDDGTLAKSGPVSDFPELIERERAGLVAPLLRTIESWLRTARDGKKSRGVKLTEKAEYDGKDELRGAAGNGYLPGRFSQGYS